MDISELKKIILAADRQAMCGALTKLTEKQRATLLPEAVHAHRIVEDGIGPASNDQKRTVLEGQEWFDPQFLKAMQDQTYPDWRCPRWTSSLMMLGVGDEKFVKEPFSFDCGWVDSDLRQMPQRVLQVLKDRRPKWLPAFAKRDVKQEFPTIAWTVEYGLICAGVLPENESEDFYRRMALAPLMSEHYASDAVKHDSLPPREKDLASYLRANPNLIETHIWKLFDYDAGAFNFSHSPWFDAFKTLSENGDIDRSRLLKVTAAALSRPSRPKELAGYGKLHELLEPSVDERETLTEDYLAALNSEHSAVVGCGLVALEKLAKAKKLDAASFLNRCDNALRLPKKAQPVKAIKLIKTLVKQQPEIAAQASEVLTIGLSHERPDVQEATVKELELLTPSFTDSTREQIATAHGDVASVLQSRVAALLDASASDGSENTKATDSTKKTAKATKKKSAASKSSASANAANASAMKALTARLAKVDATTRQTSAADSALDLIKSGGASFVAAIKPGDVPRRDPDQTVQPIESLEELIDTVATVIERVDDAMDIERVIDGIAFFGQERPADFEKRVTPLRKRIQKLDEPYSRNVIDLGAQVGFSQLLANWLDIEPIRRDFDAWYDLDGMLFRQRCADVIEDWRMKRKPRRLLALPTHRGGWVDPEVLVSRTHEYYLKARRVTNNADISQALLRMTPDGREAALTALNALPGRPDTHRIYGCGPELPYALGEESDFGNDPGYTWVYRRHSAAMHARRLVEAPDFEPRCPVASATMNDDFTIRVDGPFTDDPSLPERLCVRAFSRSNSGLPDARESSWTLQLEAMVCPANPQPMFMLGHLDPVFDPDFTWTREAARVVMTASCGESKELRLQATDALIDGFGQVRSCPELVGRQLHGLGEFLTLKRSAEVLANVGQVSELHQRAVFHTIDEFITQLHAVPKDLHFALTPMLEAALQSGETISDSCRAVFGTIKGSSKTAKLAKQLLAVEADAPKQMKVRIQAATAAIERAERWAKLRASLD